MTMTTRSIRRQVRLVQTDRGRRRSFDESDDWVVYDFVEPADQPPCSFTRLVTCFNRCQRMQQVLIVICLFTLWIPLIRDTSSHPLIENQRSNITRHQSSSSMSVDLWSGFNSESLMNRMMTMCCVGAVIICIRSHAIKLNHPIIESLNCHRLSILLIFSSIFNQLATGLIARPLEIIADLRFQSILIFQIIGFFFALFSAFIFGVLYVAYPGVEFTNDRLQPAGAE